MNPPIYDLDFRLVVDCNLDYSEFKDEMIDAWSDLDIVWSPLKGGTTAENLISTEKNVIHESSRTTSDDGWLYYPYSIDVTFLKRSGSDEDYVKQRDFAHLLASRLRDKKKWVVKIIGAIED